MYIRCGNCRTCTRLDLGRQDPADCDECGRAFVLDGIRVLGATPHERSERALAYAEEHEIDLASAYSVLLGILRLEECRALLEERAPSAPPATKPAGSHGEDLTEHTRTSYDRGFRQAVSEGHVTAQLATLRGDRVSYASRLAQRHRLTMHVAFLVADNRITLREALEPSTDLLGAVDAPGEQAPAVRPYLVAGLILLVAGMLAWRVGREAAELKESGEPRTATAAEVTRPLDTPVVEAGAALRLDPDGQVTQIVGQDPRSVLQAFCESGKPSLPRLPLGVAPAQEGWIGSYRQGGVVFGIKIREDPTTARWIAGNAVDPIRPQRGS